MASSVFEMHSIIKVGKHFYSAIAKGAIDENHMLLGMKYLTTMNNLH